jgi:hypothetical protein
VVGRSVLGHATATAQQRALRTARLRSRAARCRPPAEITARFQNVERLGAELTSEIALLKKAVAESQAAREIGIGHNQGPPLPFEELDGDTANLLALLKDKGPRPTPADREQIAEQAEKTLQLSERIKTWLGTLAIEGAKIGAREVSKDLTAPLWAKVAQKLAEFCHALTDWLSSLLS